MRIAVAVSGGVDSLCALLLLRRAGHDVLALHGVFHDADGSGPQAGPQARGEGGTEAPGGGMGAPVPELAAACRALDVELHVADLRAAFEREVAAPFARDYARGRTPNPCALCNRAIKFGALMDAALALGAEKLATGHYARLADGAAYGAPGPLLAAALAPPAAVQDVCVDKAPNDANGDTVAGADTAAPGLRASARTRPPALHSERPADLSPAQPPLPPHHPKDQSYFLALVPGERLTRALFPLARLRKDQCAALVARAGLAVPLNRESQDICFAPGGGDAYRAVLERRWRAAGFRPPAGGPVCLLEQGAHDKPRRIGTHAGLWRYTEGQRKGLGIAWEQPLYVLGKDMAANTLLVGPRASLGMRGCEAVNVVVAVEPGRWPARLFARLRHRGELVPARACLLSGPEPRLRIRLDTAAFPTAPGQVAALYDATGIILAAGIVEQVERL